MSLKVDRIDETKNDFPRENYNNNNNKRNKNEISSLRGDGARPDTNCTNIKMKRQLN